MDNERATALLKWINSVSGTSILFIRDFCTLENVRILVKALHLIDKDSVDVLPDNTEFTIDVLLSCLISYLGGFYHQMLDGIVDAEMIAVDADEIEIGKLITLLLCGAAQCDNVNYFISGIQSLEVGVQYQLKEIIETVLQEVERGGLDGNSMATLLRHTANSCAKEKQACAVESPASGKSPVETLFSSSPFMSLMSSPQLKTKQSQFALNKLHQKVNKLQMALDTQTHVQSTLEDDLAEMNKAMDAKDGKIKELNKEVVRLTMTVDDLEETQHYKTDFEKLDRENERLKQRIAELEDFKDQSNSLEERMAKFLEEKAIFEKQVEDIDQLKAKCERYKTQLHHHEFQASELKAALTRRDLEMSNVERERDEALRAASESMELWKARRTPEPEADEERFDGDGSPVDVQHHNLDSRVIELEFANERLRHQLASTVDPMEVQRLRDALEDAEQSRRSYETNYVDAKCKILELEDNASKSESQAEIREDELKQKIEDAEKALESSQEKLAHTRKELSRVQCELSVSRDEVEAHAIASEKQRAAASQALDDANTERKKTEQLAANKYNELRHEMDTKEREAGDLLEETRKQCDVKIRHVTDELHAILESQREVLHKKTEEFDNRENDLQATVRKFEAERDAVRIAYEEMLANLKTELENEVKSHAMMDAAFQQATADWNTKEQVFLKDKAELQSELMSQKEREAKLDEDTARLNEELASMVEKEKVTAQTTANLEKEIALQKDHEQRMLETKSDMCEEVAKLKENIERMTQEKVALDGVIAVLKSKEAMWTEEKAQINMELASMKDAFVLEMQSTKGDLEAKHQESLTMLRKVNEDVLQKQLDREQNEKDLTETCSRLKEEMNATEDKLLDITRERDKLEDELLSERQAGKEDVDRLAQEMEQLKEGHSKAMGEVMAALQEKSAVCEEVAKLKENIERMTQEKGDLDGIIAALKSKEAVWMGEKAQINMELASMKDAFVLEMQSTKGDLEAKHHEGLTMLRKVNEDVLQKLLDREQSVEDLTETCNRLKQEMNATEYKLLDITRERNKLEGELLSARQAGKENVDRLAQEMEQLKEDHSLAMGEVMVALQVERTSRTKESKEMGDQLDHACHGLKAAADEIGALKLAKEEIEKLLTQERNKVRQVEKDLESARENFNAKQKGIYEEATKKHSLMEEAYEADRTSWKNKLEVANDEMVKLRREMFESSQKHSAELIGVRRQVQEKEDQMEIENKNIQEEIQRMQEKLASAETCVQELQGDLNATETRRTALEEDKKKLESLFEELESKEKESQIEIEKIKKCFEVTQEKLASAEASVQVLQEKMDGTESKRGALEDENEKLQTAFEELESKKKESQLRIEKMKNCFEEEIEKMKEEHKKEVCAKENIVGKLNGEVEELKENIEKLCEEKNAKVANMEEESKKTAKDIEEKVTAEIEKLKAKAEQNLEPIKELEAILQAVETERDEVKKEYETARVEWEEKETEITGKLAQSEQLCEDMKEDQELLQRLQEEIAKMEEYANVLKEENGSLVVELEEEQMINKRLGRQVNSLEAQIKHADMTIREQKNKVPSYEHQSENIKKTKKMLIEVEKVLPVENAKDFLDESTTTESDDSEMCVDDLGLSRQNSTVSFASTISGSEFSKSVSSFSGISRSSLRSTTTGHHMRAPASRRQSAMYVKGSTPPTRRTTSSAAFFIVGDEFANNMEPESEYDFDWDRLAELERRNTICPPHLKTSYPVETQTRPADKESNTLRSARSETTLNRKRKLEEESCTHSKQRKNLPSSKSEGEIKRSKSKRLTDMVSSKISSLRSKSNENLNKEKTKGGNSVAFEITPPKGKPITRNTNRTSPEKNSKSTMKSPPSKLDAAAKRESLAFTIDNSPPRKSGRVQRTRTINRSTASTQLVREKDKETFKREKLQESRNRIPLRHSNRK